MCFSAPVSFTASGVLGLVGGANLKLARKKNESLLALMPFLFGVQQFFEGVIWLKLNNGPVDLGLALSFLFFALFLWPVYVPLMVFLMEKNKLKRLLLLVLLGMGVVVGVSLFFIAFMAPVSVGTVSGRIVYSFNLSSPLFWNLSYIFVVLTSFFVSSNKFLRVFGLSIMAAVFASQLLYSYAFPSVWCFFSAVLSGMIYLNFKAEGEESSVFERLRIKI